MTVLSSATDSSALLSLYAYQFDHCAPYRRWSELVGGTPSEVERVEQIPFLPIEFFRSFRVYGAATKPELTFSSSGTTGGDTSRHFVADHTIYEEAFRQGFNEFYGDASKYSIFALLPGYLERPDSSLVYMVEKLHGENPSKGGFFLNDLQAFKAALEVAVANGEKIFVIGVTFALVEFARTMRISLPSDAVVMETGGMKGRGRSIERIELHQLLGKAFGVQKIHSEYGMTELLSQGYSKGEGLFYPTQTMRVIGRSLGNPLKLCKAGSEIVGLNIIDTANIHSCSFIATGDQGRVHHDGSFEVLGRIEGEILRGCNML